MKALINTSVRTVINNFLKHHHNPGRVKVEIEDDKLRGSVTVSAIEPLKPGSNYYRRSDETTVKIIAGKFKFEGTFEDLINKLKTPPHHDK